MAIAQEKVAKYSNRVMGLSVMESFIGFCVATLAIIGLCQVVPAVLVSIATIVVGAALMFQSGALRVRFSAVMEEMDEDIEVTKGLSTPTVAVEFLAATIAIALGVLSVIGIIPYILVPIAAIALGIAFFIHSGIIARINALENIHSGSREWTQLMTNVRSGTAASLQGSVGVAAIALGIIALTGAYPIILSLVAILALGAVHVLHGTTVVRIQRANARRLRGGGESHISEHQESRRIETH